MIKFAITPIATDASCLIKLPKGVIDNIIGLENSAFGLASSYYPKKFFPWLVLVDRLNTKDMLRR